MSFPSRLRFGHRSRRPGPPSGSAHQLRRYLCPYAKMPNVHRSRQAHNSMTSLSNERRRQLHGFVRQRLTVVYLISIVRSTAMTSNPGKRKPMSRTRTRPGSRMRNRASWCSGSILALQAETFVAGISNGSMRTLRPATVIRTSPFFSHLILNVLTVTVISPPTRATSGTDHCTEMRSSYWMTPRRKSGPGATGSSWPSR